eukprot:TRINITY_DN10186_c0_g2_i2.p1 TRINITY_DN10186_c0_g2~~TRINITY_DN10186_c0_g2_i2.p1  ORF type:complete len:232 (-),score=44.61 TRINITY_DN10186_c0_g2_i2:64-759(-)
MEDTSASSSTPTPAAGSTENSDKRPDSYLVLFNVGKKQNFGTLLRSACAFGVTEVLIVGAAKLQTFGNQGTAQHAQTRHFESLEAAKEWLASKGARLCGIEIDDSAKPVTSHPFSGSTAFMLGNEGAGMTPQQRAACDFFTYIPQHSGATASLNVAVAGSIVLHHFATWAAMPEHPRSGEKYVVQEARSALDRFQNPTEVEQEEIERKRRERAAKRRLEEDPAEGAECDDS